MYNGSKEVKGEAIHRKKCQEHRGNEQGKGGDSKGEIARGNWGDTSEK